MTKARSNELKPGEYLLPGGQRLQVFDDGAVAIRPARDKRNALQKAWLMDAPFTYDEFIRMMESRNYMIAGQWNFFQTRGNRKTASFTVRGCYERLFTDGCLPEMAMERVREAFNEVGAHINNARTLDCACCHESDLFQMLFQSSEL